MLLMAWWDWWRATPKYWYTLRVARPDTGAIYLGPRQLTETAALNWQLDEQENQWDAQVNRYRWTGYGWAAT